MPRQTSPDNVSTLPSHRQRSSAVVNASSSLAIFLECSKKSPSLANGRQWIKRRQSVVSATPTVAKLRQQLANALLTDRQCFCWRAVDDALATLGDAFMMLRDVVKTTGDVVAIIFPDGNSRAFHFLIETRVAAMPYLRRKKQAENPSPTTDEDPAATSTATSTVMSSSTTSTSSATTHAASSSGQEENNPPLAPPTPSLHVHVDEEEEDAVRSGSTEPPAPPDLTQPFTDEQEMELAEWYRANPIFYDRSLRTYKETVKKKRIMDERASSMEPPRKGIIACCHGNNSEKLCMWLRLVPVRCHSNQLSRDKETRFLCDFLFF